MVDINLWMKQYQNTVQDLFGSRVLFIGLQGSYGRNEAHDNSDIDVVLVLDTVSLTDLKQYKQVLKMIPDRSRMCGFVSGREELASWCKADLFQFYHDTISCYGSLDSIIQAPTDADARAAVLIGACNLYHMCSHNYLHENDLETLRNLYKSAFFILQAKHYSETGSYIRSHLALNDVLSGTDQVILQYAKQVMAAEESRAAFDRYSDLLLRWTHQLICEYSAA